MPQGLSAGPQRPTGPARREAGQSQDRAERAEGHPGPPAGGPVRCGQRRTPTRGGGGRFPGWFHGWFGCNRCTPWLRRWQRDRGQVQRQEIASTLTGRRSSAVLLRGGPPDLLSQFLSHSLRYAGSSDLPTVHLDLQFRGAQGSVLPFVVAKEPCCLVGCRMVFGVHGLEHPQIGTAAPPLRSPT